MSAPAPHPTSGDLRRFARYVADERTEASIYRALANRRTGEEREILLELVAAEGRHEAYWLRLIGDSGTRIPAPSIRARLSGWMARHFGEIFVLAVAQNAEGRSPYANERFATPALAADERIHHEVVRGLAANGRRKLSGTFRAAVFGANDGLVSNLALVMGIGATGVAPQFVLFSGLAGLLSGALSMGAGEFVSVRSQRELLDATEPNTYGDDVLPDLDLDANELALVFRTRGMSHEDAEARASEIIDAAKRSDSEAIGSTRTVSVHHDVVGTGMRAAVSSFLFFASGAIVPVLPWIFGLTGLAAVLVALVLVGTALLATGAMVGLLSGGPPLKRALRQLAIGFGAAGVTYALGLLFGVSLA